MDQFCNTAVKICPESFRKESDCKINACLLSKRYAYKMSFWNDSFWGVLESS